MSDDKTSKNLKVAYAEESKALVRNRLFAEIADEEGYEQIGKLFRAVAEAESVHAKNALRSIAHALLLQVGAPGRRQENSERIGVVADRTMAETACHHRGRSRADHRIEHSHRTAGFG